MFATAAAVAVNSGRRDIHSTSNCYGRIFGWWYRAPATSSSYAESPQLQDLGSAFLTVPSGYSLKSLDERTLLPDHVPHAYGHSYVPNRGRTKKRGIRSAHRRQVQIENKLLGCRIRRRNNCGNERGPMHLFLATPAHDQHQSLASTESAQPLGGTRRVPWSRMCRTR